MMIVMYRILKSMISVLITHRHELNIVLDYWSLLLQYLDVVGWVFRPVKPTTKSENRLQLDSLSSFVNINRLTTVDNTSAVGNDTTAALEWCPSQ